MTELDPTTRDIVTRLVEVVAQRNTLEEEEKHLKALLRKSLDVGEKGSIDGRDVVALQPNRRFSASLAEQLPEPLRALCTVTKIDSATAKKNLPPAVYESLMETAGEPKVALL